MDKKNWYSPGAVERHFSKRQVIWVLENLGSLREGHWPANPGETGYIDQRIKQKHLRPTNAYFAKAIEVASEVQGRLLRCGLDGLLVLGTYCWGESLESLARYAGMSPWVAQRRIKKAFDYACGEDRKIISYHDFKDFKGVPKPEAK